MSTPRYSSVGTVFPQKRGDDGKPLCRFCQGALPKGRRTFCSGRCVDEALVHTSPAHARRRVARRDGGVCAGCGLDTRRLQESMEAVRHLILHRPHSVRDRWLDALCAAVRPELEWAAKRLLRLRGWGNRHLWEADHIQPVAKGGGLCGLDNYQTLCIRCHGRKSGKQRRKTTPQLELGVSA